MWFVNMFCFVYHCAASTPAKPVVTKAGPSAIRFALGSITSTTLMHHRACWRVYAQLQRAASRQQTAAVLPARTVQAPWRRRQAAMQRPPTSIWSGVQPRGGCTSTPGPCARR